MFDIPFPVHRRSMTMTTDTKGAGKYAKVNDINLYYETHGDGPPPGRRLSQHPARRDLSGDASPTRPGERGRRRVHERHTDVPALPEGRTTSRGLPAAARQDRRIDVEGLRLLRGGPWSPGADA